jgi:hypothetical protein
MRRSLAFPARIASPAIPLALIYPISPFLLRQAISHRLPGFAFHFPNFSLNFLVLKD